MHVHTFIQKFICDESLQLNINIIVKRHELLLFNILIILICNESH